jgi:hypothetical protein
MLFAVCPAFLLLDRKPRPGGFYALSFAAFYIPVRFALDFLRIADTRYLGLTPGQWAALAVLPFVGWAMRKIIAPPPPAGAPSRQ